MTQFVLRNSATRTNAAEVKSFLFFKKNRKKYPTTHKSLCHLLGHATTPITHDINAIINPLSSGGVRHRKIYLSVSVSATHACYIIGSLSFSVSVAPAQDKGDSRSQAPISICVCRLTWRPTETECPTITTGPSRRSQIMNAPAGGHYGGSWLQKLKTFSLLADLRDQGLSVNTWCTPV